MEDKPLSEYILTPQRAMAQRLNTLIEALLGVVSKAGSKGVAIKKVKAWYDAMGVPTAVADQVERKLVADGMIRVSKNRMFFAATKETIQRLSGTRG